MRARRGSRHQPAGWRLCPVVTTSASPVRGDTLQRGRTRRRAGTGRSSFGGPTSTSSMSASPLLADPLLLDGDRPRRRRDGFDAVGIVRRLSPHHRHRQGRLAPLAVPSSSSRSTPARRCATSQTPPGTLTPAPPAPTTAAASLSTDSRGSTSPPRSPPDPGHGAEGDGMVVPEMFGEEEGRTSSSAATALTGARREWMGYMVLAEAGYSLHYVSIRLA